MATKQHSSRKNSRKRVPSSSKRSDWAAYMQGADPEWLSSREALDLAIVFDGHFPAWLIESEPWRKVSGVGFRTLRQMVLGISTEQCAAYLGIHRSTICRWESGEVEIPRAAYEVLRLLSVSACQRLSHKHWDGWFINRQTGELVSPDVGRLAVKPEEINGLPRLYNRLSNLMLHVANLEGQVEVLVVENAELRSGDKSRQITAELEAMQERIARILGSVRTAEIIEFNTGTAELRRAAG